MSERAREAVTEPQSGRWGVLLVLLGVVSLEMGSIEGVMESAQLHARALQHCGVGFDCCSELATHFATQMWDNVRGADGSVAIGWVLCASAALAFAVRVLWCGDLPRLVRWAVLGYALYTTVWVFVSKPVS